MKLVIFGTGKCYQRLKNRFRKEEILALVDNDDRKIGSILDDHIVISPCEIKNIDYDKIVVLVYHYKKIQQQLLELGLKQDSIITVDNMEDYKKYRKFEIINDRKETNRSSILLVSHEMNFRGAPLMLFNLGKILVEQGYNVSVMSNSQGELCDKFIENNVKVIIVDDFDFNQEEIGRYIAIYDLIVINTLAMWKLVSRLALVSKEVIWWLHEEESAYGILNIPSHGICVGANIHVYGVGKRAVEAWKKHMGRTVPIQELRWGIKEESCRSHIYHRRQCVFAVIGPVCYIKGQDILVSVIKRNIEKWKDKLEVWFIGAISDAEKKDFEKIPFVKCYGELPHNEVMKLYQDIDVTISTSRNDTMPVVLVESMMQQLVCLSSDATGVADYIIPYKNGLVFRANDESDLENKIQWLIENRDRFELIGKEAYDTYQKNFSMAQFRCRVKEIINGYLITDF